MRLTGIVRTPLAAALACSAFLACSAEKVKSPEDAPGVSSGGYPGTGGTPATGTGGRGAGATDAGADSAADSGLDGGARDGSAGQTSLDATPGEPDSPTVYCVNRPTDEELTPCGEYLVRHLAACGDCHSPSADPALFLTGNPSVVDLDPTPGVGNVPAPNLTLLKSDGWTLEDVTEAIVNGTRSAARGGGLFPIMPYSTLHNLARVDARAIALYVLSLPPAGSHLALREALPAPFSGIALPVPPVPRSAIPEPGPAAADHQSDAEIGRYLAGTVASCMACHTPRVGGQLDPTRLFAGGESFPLPAPFPTVVSANLTPAPNGIAGYAPADIGNAIRAGVRPDGSKICPPMPTGPDGAYGGIPENEGLLIGYYLTSLAPIASPADGGVFPKCTPPAP